MFSFHRITSKRLVARGNGLRLGRVSITALILIVLLTAVLPAGAYASVWLPERQPQVAGQTTAGALTLVALVNTISVVSSFSADAGNNNSVVLEYKKSTDTGWVAGVPMSVDRRATIWSDDGASTANGYYNTWRAAIWSYQGALLQPNTSYDVRVTYSDPNGVSGTNPQIGTVITRNDNPPSSGNTYYVATTGNDSTGDGSSGNPWKTITGAMGKAQVVAGVTIRVRAGTYNEGLSITKSGTSGNFITITSDDPSNMATVSGTAHWDQWDDAVVVQGSYVRIKQLNIRGGAAGVRLVGNYNIVDSNNIQGFLASGSGFWGGAVYIHASKGQTILGNTVYKGTQIGINGDPRPTDGDDGWGIFLYKSPGENVIKGNSITGVSHAYRDCISGNGDSGNAGYYAGYQAHNAIYNNTVSGWYDDSLELEGPNVNTLVFGNTAIGNVNYSIVGVAMAPALVGPAYWFRNVIKDWNGTALKLGEHSNGPIFIWQNTWYSTASIAGDGSTNGPADVGSYHQSTNVAFYNNIVSIPNGAGFIFEGGDPNPVANDYDLLYKTSGWRAWFNGSEYTSLSSYKTGTGRETHGSASNPLFVDPATNNFTLQSTSPARNTGVVLPGVNDSSSPWAYLGSAPDIGAFEYDESSPTTTPPTITTGSAGSITATSATLNGSLTSLGTASAVNVSFEYGTTTGYGTTTANQSRTVTGAVSASLSGLTASTTYHYRAKAVGDGTDYGSDGTFTTGAAPTTPPTVTTGSTSSVTASGATLNGNLTSLGTATTVNVSFEYGTTTGYGTTTANQSRTVTGAVSASLSGLTASTTYHYRAKAVGDGTDYGSDGTFTTGAAPTTPPTVTTGSTSSVTASGATLNGNLTSLGTATTVNVSFEYGTTTGYGTTTANQSRTVTGAVSASLSGLTASTTYHYRAKAVGDGTDYGSDGTFTTGAAPTTPPTVTTGSTSSVTASGATLNGNLTSLGTATTVNVSFEYGTTTGYGTTTANQSRTVTGAVSASLSGLTASTTYHYRAKAVGDGTDYGSDGTFTTGAAPTTPPTVTTGSTSSVTASGATLNGNLTSLGTATTVNVSFEYGTTTGYGTTTANQSRTVTGAVSASLSGLTASTTYHYRAKAVGDGTDYGSDGTFTTGAAPTTPPTITTGSAGSITATSATLNASLTSLGTASAVNVSFEYGTTTGYGTTTANQSRTVTGAVSASLSGLTASTTYHYRAKAVGDGTDYGSDGTFTTGAAPTPPGGGGGGVPLSNRAPEFSPIGNRATTEGQLLSFTISATDPDGNALIYYASNLPSGAVFSPLSRTFTWTPSLGQAGTYDNVHFEVSDGTLIAFEDISITVVADQTTPVISGIVVLNVTGNSVEISWHTDEPSTGQVEYGASLSNLSVSDKKMGTDHVILLTGLTSGTTYSYIVLSKDEAGNLAQSDKQTFRTNGGPAVFRISDLNVPAARVGEKINIRAVVSNDGDTAGSRDVLLKIDGEVVATTIVEMAPQTNGRVTFTVMRGAVGVFAVDVNGIAASLVVKPMAEVVDLMVTPVYNDGNTVSGMLEAARIGYTVAASSEPSGDADLLLKVFLNSKPFAQFSILSSGRLVPGDNKGELVYTPAQGWKDGEYAFQTELYLNDALVHTSGKASFVVLPQSIAEVVNWNTLGKIVGIAFIVIVVVTGLLLYRKRDMLRDYS